MKVVAAVHHTTFCMAQPLSTVPSLIFFPLHRIRMFRRWYKKANLVYNDPTNFYRLAAGHPLNYFLGQNKFLRFVAMCALICDRFDGCITQIETVEKSYRNLKNAFRRNQDIEKEINWVVEPGLSLTSPSTNTSMSRTSRIGWETFKRIIFCIGKLFKETFELSMQLIDTVEACSLSPEAQSDSIQELFLKGLAQRVDQLVRNEQRILNMLTKNKVALGKFFTDIRSPIKVEDLIEEMGKLINKTKTVQKVAEVGNGVLVHVAQEAITGFALSLNLQDHVPACLKPKVNPDCFKTFKKLEIEEA